jgi:ABC-type transporter Mla subunit MlaD
MRDTVSELSDEVANLNAEAEQLEDAAANLRRLASERLDLLAQVQMDLGEAKARK